MQPIYNKHYIRTDAKGCIKHGFSDAFEKPTENNILLTDQGGYQFRLFPGGEENPNLYTFDGVPLYRWDSEKVVERSEEEIQADRAAMRAAQEAAEQERINNATETVLLEMVADQEARLCLLEMGVSEDDL